MYTSSKKCGKVHKTKCHVSSKPLSQGRSRTELLWGRGAPPCKTPSFFTFHWLWNSPQGSAGKGGGSLGGRSTFSAEPALGWELCASGHWSDVGRSRSVTASKTLSSQLGRERSERPTPIKAPPESPISELRRPLFPGGNASFTPRTHPAPGLQVPRVH